MTRAEVLWLKIIGVLLILLGMVLFASPTVTYTTREKVIKTGALNVTAKHQKTIVIPRLVSIRFLALPVGSFAQVQPAAKPGDPIAAVAGQPISEEDLAQAMGPQWMQLRSQEYEAKSKALESIIRLKLVEVEAKNQGISPQKLVEQEVDSKVADPNDSEVEAYFWGQNRSGLRYEDVKDQFRANLKQLKIQKARQAYADSLKATNEVVVMLRPPSIEVSYDTARVKGGTNAPVTIVEFSDFQCPFCQKADLTVKQLLRKYDGRVKVAYRDFPLLEIHAQCSDGGRG